MKTALLNIKLVGLLMMGLMIVGCTIKGTKNPVINLEAAQNICGKSVEVHLIGVNKSQKESWDTVSMTKYWQPENQIRKSAKPYTIVVSFEQGPCEITIPTKHPTRRIWKKRKAEYLYILADLPGIFYDKGGNADARRLRIPAFKSECWSLLNNTIKISIDSGGIACLTTNKCE